MGDYLWILYGLGAALGLASADALTKRYFTGLTPYGMSLVRLVFALPYLGAVWLFTPTPPLSAAFFGIVAAALPLETAAALMYMRALQVSPLSLCAPMLAFTPVFLILTGHLLLGELPTGWGLGGIAAVTLGSYLLNLDWRDRGWWAPLSALWRQSGPRLMLGVAALYACTSVLGKLAVQHSAPTFFGLFYPCTFAGIMLLGYPWSSPRPGRGLFSRPGAGLLLGLCMAATPLCHFHGIQAAPAAYFIATKRLSLLFSVLYGGLLFREGLFRQRLLGAGLMAVGVGLIAVKG